MGRRTRSRARSGGGPVRKIAVVLLLLGAVGVVGATAVSSFAFSSVQGDRGANVNVAADDEALIGIELADSVAVGGGGNLPNCAVTNDTVVVTGKLDSGINTPHGVVVESGARVEGDVQAGGCVDVQSGARVDGSVTAGGDVRVRSGGRIDGSVDTDGDVTLESGARVRDDVDSGGDVSLSSGARVDGSVSADEEVSLDSSARIDGDVRAGEDVTLGSGARVRGDVESGGEVVLESGARIDGDVIVTAESQVSLAPGARIDGEILVDSGAGGGGGGGPAFLLSVTNNIGQTTTVTVSLTDLGDGALLAGSQSGPSVTFQLDPGEQQTINIAPSGAPGGQIEFEVEAQTVNGGASVTLARSVPTV